MSNTTTPTSPDIDPKKTTNEEIDKFLEENWTEWHDSLYGMVLRKGSRYIRAVDAARLLKVSVENWREMNLDSLWAELIVKIEDERLERARRLAEGKQLDKINIPLVRKTWPRL
jgi:hypothetical protein